MSMAPLFSLRPRGNPVLLGLLLCDSPYPGRDTPEVGFAQGAPVDWREGVRLVQ